MAAILIVGNTRDEMTMMVLGMPMPADTAAYTEALERELVEKLHGATTQSAAPKTKD